MTTWKEIISKPGWSDLDLATKQEVRNQWINEDVAPTLVDDPDRDAVLQELYNEPLDTGEGLARSMLGSAARGFLDPLASVPEVAGAYTGIESLEELGGDIRSGIESTFPVNPAQQGILTDVAGVAGQVGQIAATGGLGAASGIGLAGKAATKAAQLRAASLGARAAQQGAMGASAVAGGLERAEQIGLDNNERLIRGLLAGGTELATEKLGGFATELGPINKLLGQSAEEQWFKPVIRGILTEAGEEGAAETAGQATDIAMSDNAPEMDLKQIGYAMLLGGAGGAMFGGVEAAIAPRTAEAYKNSGAFVPVRNIADLPADIDPNDDENLVYDSKDRLIGYKPKATEATVETELPYEAPIEINVDEQLPEPVRAEVEAMVANVDETPETSATAAALAEDAGAIAAEISPTQPIETQEDAIQEQITDESLLRQGRPEMGLQEVEQGDTQVQEAAGEGQAQEAQVTNVPLTQEALQQEQISVEAVPQPRELPALPEEPTAQAPEAAVGADAAELEQQWQDSPQFAAAEEAAAAGDMERADAIEAEWRAANQQVSPEPTGAVPTESLPAGQPMSGDMGAAVTVKIPVDKRDSFYEKLLAKGKPAGRNMVSLEDSQVTAAVRKKLYSDRDAASGFPGRPQETQSFYLKPKSEVTGIASDRGWILKDKRPDLLSRLQPKDATPNPPQQQQPATPATQETQPEAAASATQQPAEETGDAGVTISDSATTEGPSTAVATDVGVAESQSASERLRADIATLPAKSQAAWTPELLAIADSYYQSGDKKLLDALTAVQRKRVYANALSESEQAAYEAEQKAAFALRNPPAATYADAANDPNVFIDSLSEAELQQGIEMREKSPEQRKSLLRQNDGSVIRTGVTPRAAEAARNSYTGVIPGIDQTWLGTAAEFQEQHPDGIDWGNGKMSQPDADVEAGVAANGRSYVFIDRVQLLEGDVKRAEQYGTTPQGEAVKRLLRHESFGHRGAMSLPAPLRNRFVDMIASGVIPEAELDYIVNERGYSAYAGWRDNIAKQIMLGEEWLAHKMEGIRAIPQSGPMAQMMDWLRDVWAWLTGAERAMLPELRDMMREMHRALGALKPEQRVVDGTRASLQQSPLDAEYFAAVEAGDMEKAQRMVDEAARGAGYNIGPVFHGTAEDFTVFDTEKRDSNTAEYGRGLLFFTDELKLANEYSKTGSGKLKELQGKVYKAIDKWSYYTYDLLPERMKYMANWDNAHRLTEPLNDLLDSGVITREQYDRFYELEDEIYSLNDQLSRLEKPEGNPRIVRAFLKIPNLVEEDAGDRGVTFGSWDVVNTSLAEQMEADGADGFLAKNVYDSPFGTEMRADVYAVRNPNQIKSADPVTYDSSGAIIPLSQRFQSTSNDIRYSRQQQTISAQVDALSYPDTAETSQAHPMAFEREYGYLPAKYYKMAEKGEVSNALREYAIEAVAPYATSTEKLRELLSILRDDRQILDNFGIGATTGQAGLGYIYGEAALQSQRLGNQVLAEEFAFGRKAIGTSKGQGLIGEKFLVNEPRYQSLFASEAADAVTRDEQRATVEPKFGAEVPRLLDGELERSTVAAGENVADAVDSEILISEKVLELGAAVQGNPKLSERIKAVIQKVIDRGNAMRALQKIRNAMRASIVPDSSKFDKMTEAELEAEIARLEAEIAADIDFIEKETEATKEKTPTDTAKKIINRIINKNKVKADRKKDEPDPVEVLYKQDLQSPMDEADFIGKAKAIGVDAATAMELKNAIDLEITANSLKATLSTLGGDIEKNIKKANEEANKFQKQAERIIDKVVDSMADPPLVKEKRKKAKDPIQEAYRNQVKSPVSREKFIDELSKINVFDQTADMLFDAAAMEKAGKEAVVAAKNLPPVPKATAKAIIARVQKKAASETTKAKPKLDRVRVLYKSHLRERMDEAKFTKEAITAGLDAKTAKELYEAAELEIAAVLLSKEVRGSSESYDKLTKERLKHLDVDSSALVEYVNRLRKEGKLGEVTWRDIMQLPPTRQQVIKDSLFDLVSKNPDLQNLSEQEKRTLADALEKMWERERDRQFKMQVKRMELPGVKKDDRDKLEEATPRLIRLINQGMTTSDAFYKAVGEQYGIKELSEADRKRVVELSEKIQDPTMGKADKAKYARELVNLLQKNYKLTRSEILSNVWVAHVLSGVRTQFDMALGVMNGLFSTVKKAGTVIYKNPNKKGFQAAGKGLQQFFVGFADGVGEAIRYVRTDEPGLIDSDIEFVSSYFDGGIAKGGISTARKLKQSDNSFMRALGKWLSILERVNTGWDVINFRATLQGTMAMASQMNPTLYKESLMPTDADYAAMRERAKTMLGPTATRAQITARAMSYVTDGLHLLGKNLEQSDTAMWKQMSEDFKYDASESSYMVDPTGLGGYLYRAVRDTAMKGEKAAKERSEDAKKKLAAGDMDKGEQFSKNIFPPLLYLLATQARNILGVRFIRFTGNKINELISFIPGLGLARVYLEEGMRRDGQLTIKGMGVLTNHFLGIAIGIPALIKALGDLEDEDEERGYIVQGPWDNLTPARKSQLMSNGFKPNTIAFYDKKSGKWTSYNYINWPSAGWLATLGSVSDYRRYTPEKWNDKQAADKIMSGIYAGGSSFMDISSISQMAELFGRSNYSTDPSTKGIEKITKTAAGYVGGFMPRLFKDIDSWMDDSAYRPEKWWESFAKEVPVLRRSAGAPIRDIFYEKVGVSRAPWSRAMQVSPDDPAYQKLARLNAKGIWLTPPNPENRKVRRGGATRALTEDEAAAYMSETGAKYKEFILKRGDALVKMDADRAAELIEKTTARIREIALKRAIARGGKAVTIEAE